MIYRFKYFFELFESFVRNVYDSFISLIKVLVLTKFNVRLPNEEGKECIVLGNGPSFKNTLEKHKDFFSDKPLFCVNMFPSSKEYLDLQPGNLVWLDSGFYLIKDKELLAEQRPDVLKAINDVIERTSWPLNLYIPVLSKNAGYIKEIGIKNQNVKICYFNYTIVKGFSFLRHFLFKTNFGMPLCQNVLGAGLFLALNIGYKKIYLFGADNDVWKNVYVNDQNELCMLHQHFYTKGEVASTKVKEPDRNKKVNLAEFYILCVKTFKMYYVIEEYAKYLKAKIYNATEGSFIDAFERKKL